ncbi:unnamed protein product [Cochlearia groenlandica]
MEASSINVKDSSQERDSPPAVTTNTTVSDTPDHNSTASSTVAPPPFDSRISSPPPPKPQVSLYQPPIEELLNPVGVAAGISTEGIVHIGARVMEEGESKGSLYVKKGNIGDEMRISVSNAYNFAIKFLRRKEPNNTFFANSKIHLQVTTQEDQEATTHYINGTSGGCAIVTSLLSLAMNKPLRKDLAMTGHITLTGHVLPISFVREKTLAARRNRINTIILPYLNRIEFEELAENEKEGLEVYYVDVYVQVFDLAFNYN